MRGTRVPGAAWHGGGSGTASRTELVQAAWVRARAACADPGGLRVLPLPQHWEGRGPGHPLTRCLCGWEERERQRERAREPVAITTRVPRRDGDGDDAQSLAWGPPAWGDQGTPHLVPPQLRLHGDAGSAGPCPWAVPTQGGQCHVGLCCATGPSCAVQSRALPWGAGLCHALPCRARICDALSCRAEICRAKPGFVMLCHAELGFATGRWALPHFAMQSQDL